MQRRKRKEEEVCEHDHMAWLAALAEMEEDELRVGCTSDDRNDDDVDDGGREGSGP